MTTTGHCLCGAVQFEYDGEPAETVHCHCESCRRQTSSPVATFVLVPRAALRFTCGEPREFASSPGVLRSFCGTCGSPIAYRTERRPDIIDLFVAFGRVSARRMFGGFGIYADGTMFALASDGVIFLKADEETSAVFEREGMGRFTYSAKGRGRTSLSYWRLPDRLYDDPEELANWARIALTAARRARAPKKTAGRLPKQKTPKAKRRGRGSAKRS